MNPLQGLLSQHFSGLLGGNTQGTTYPGGDKRRALQQIMQQQQQGQGPQQLPSGFVNGVQYFPGNDGQHLGAYMPGGKMYDNFNQQLQSGVLPWETGSGGGSGGGGALPPQPFQPRRTDRERVGGGGHDRMMGGPMMPASMGASPAGGAGAAMDGMAQAADRRDKQPTFDRDLDWGKDPRELDKIIGQQARQAEHYKAPTTASDWFLDNYKKWIGSGSSGRDFNNDGGGGGGGGDGDGTFQPGTGWNRWWGAGEIPEWLPDYLHRDWTRDDFDATGWREWWGRAEDPPKWLPEQYHRNWVRGTPPKD
jgi:hypothetical protein